MFYAWDLQFLRAVLCPHGDCFQLSMQRWEGNRLPVLLLDSADLFALCSHNAGVASGDGSKGIGWGDCLEKREGRKDPPLQNWRREVADKSQVIEYCI